MVQQHIKVPTLLLESDLIDARTLPEAEWRVKIDAFMETVDSYKKEGAKQ
jgi:hypothetical protein